MYAREIQGRVHTFGVSGKLIRNALVMFDRETDTLWSQFLSQGVEGPLKGVKLDFVGSLLTDWQSWLELYPDTKVLDKGGRYQSDPYDSYYAGGSAGILGEEHTDTRLPRKELVVGLEVNGATKAYGLSQLQQSPLVHDNVGGMPLVIVYDADSGVGVAYEATVDGRVTTFVLGDSPDGRSIHLVDEKTGAQWNAFSGEPASPGAKGKPLQRIPSFYSFWFAWKDFHPDTLVFQG